MADIPFSIEVVGHEEIKRELVRFQVAIPETVDLLAEHLIAAIGEEAPRGATGALQEDWEIRETGPLERVVEAGRDAFYAHIVARGRRGYGIDDSKGGAKALRVEDAFVMTAGPMSGDPFHDRAVARAEREVGGLLDHL